MGVRKIFPGWEKMTFCLSVSSCLRWNANWRTQNALSLLCRKENAQYYGNSCKQCSL